MSRAVRQLYGCLNLYPAGNLFGERKFSSKVSEYVFPSPDSLELNSPVTKHKCE